MRFQPLRFARSCGYKRQLPPCIARHENRSAIGRQGNAVRLKAHIDLTDLGEFLARDFEQGHVARMMPADQQRLASAGRRNRLIATVSSSSTVPSPVRTSEAIGRLVHGHEQAPGGPNTGQPRAVGLFRAAVNWKMADRNGSEIDHFASFVSMSAQRKARERELLIVVALRRPMSQLGAASDERPTNPH
jgi:hypothetical protein